MPSAYRAVHRKCFHQLLRAKKLGAELSTLWMHYRLRLNDEITNPDIYHKILGSCVAGDICAKELKAKIDYAGAQIGLTWLDLWNVDALVTQYHRALEEPIKDAEAMLQPFRPAHKDCEICGWSTDQWMLHLAKTGQFRKNDLRARVRHQKKAAKVNGQINKNCTKEAPRKGQQPKKPTDEIRREPMIKDRIQVRRISTRNHRIYRPDATTTLAVPKTPAHYYDPSRGPRPRPAVSATRACSTTQCLDLPPTLADGYSTVGRLRTYSNYRTWLILNSSGTVR